MDDPNDTFVPDATDVLALHALIPGLVADCPDIYAMAYQVAKDILLQHNITDIEPDKVYWHRFRAAQSSSKTFTGWQHVFEKPRESMTFPQLVIQRFSVHDQDNADLLDADSGFYRADGNAGNYDETNEIRLHTKDALKAFWDINFSDRYKTAIATFWEQHSADFRAMAKCTFIAKAIESYESGYLSGDQLTLVMQAAASNASRPLTRTMLTDEAQPGSGLTIRKFCIDQFDSTDILSFTDEHDLNILYLPGEPRGFYCFNKVEELHQWLVDEVKDAEGRERMFMHFKQQERDIFQERPTSLGHKLANFTGIGLIIHAFEETPIDNVGLTHAYDVLPGKHDVADYHLLHYRGEKIVGDAFSHLSQSTHERMLSDANFLLRSNGEIRKKLWIGYLNAFNHTFGPMAALAWPAALVVIGAGIANVGLQIDQAINAPTPMERKAAVTAAIFGSVDVLFNLPFLWGAAELADAAELGEYAETQEALATQTETELTPPPGLPVPIAEAGPTDAQILAPFDTNEVLDGYFPVSDDGKYKGMYQPNGGGNYIAMDDRFFQVSYNNQLKCWAIIDPTNPYSFYRNIPVRLNEENEWEMILRGGLRGGGKNLSKPATPKPGPSNGDSAQTANTSDGAAPQAQAGTSTGARAPARLRTLETPYDADPQFKRELRGWALNLQRTHVRVMRINNRLTVEDSYAPYYSRKLADLRRDAGRFFNELNWSELPPRPMLFTVDEPMSIAELIKRVFEVTHGLVVGETLDRITSLRFMIENMHEFAQRGVNTIYMRGLLSDFAQQDLNSFFESGNMSEDLKNYLISIGQDPAGRFNELELIKSAKQNNIRVQAIDNSVTLKKPIPDRLIEEQMMSNSLTNQIMQADTTLNHPGKWVVLTGVENTNTFRGMAGISELRGGIGLRIEEVDPGQSLGITLDPGIEIDRGPILQHETMRGTSEMFHADLRLQIEAPPVIRTERQTEKLLNVPGKYLFEKNAGDYTLFHQNREKQITRTPVQRLANGDYVVHRPSWPQNGVPFPSIDALSRSLNDSGLRLVTRIPT
ncbi:membrane-targeted effector domain-containing toxin [Pseudomonas sp. ANT_J28]|uniref:membrane-targeted effector domain-containing toxin n=1 Tax=Pseudomonas sp. ANT_J28 TaxID=2597352 RepID=UPI0011F1AD86|nr:membrane-targeted effector domain-containing toxin [Pseudomonas sp. ANT_J28]KAA0985407.1 toxin [Pseudomonas sp. ANT_J28]